MKQSGVSEDAVEIAIRQIQREEILLPHLTTAVSARHFRKAGRAFQPHRDVTKLGKRLEVPSRPAAKIEHCERWLALDELQQSGNILTHVVISRSFPESLGALIVVLQRAPRDSRQIRAIELHQVYTVRVTFTKPIIKDPTRGR